MFLRNASWLRHSAILLLILVVNLAGIWPLVGLSTARGVELFQRYGEFMSPAQALSQVLGGVEFCGDAPEPEQPPTDFDAQSRSNDGKLILLTQAPGLPTPQETPLERLPETLAPSLRTYAPEPPPPRA